MPRALQKDVSFYATETVGYAHVKVYGEIVRYKQKEQNLLHSPPHIPNRNDLFFLTSFGLLE